MRRFKLSIIGKSYDIEIERQDKRKFYVAVNKKRYEALIEDDSDKAMLMAVDGGLYTVELEGEPSAGKINAKVNDRERIVESKDLLITREIIPEIPISMASEGELSAEEEQRRTAPATMVNGIVAPLPGKVVSVKVNVGDDVNAGKVVVILEAMKMENEITSNRAGKISEVRVKEGDSVDADDVLVVIS